MNDFITLLLLVTFSIVIIKSVDSISRDGLDAPILFVIHCNSGNNSEHVKF